ncbi:DUF4823 domain-containing protein [Thiotrichales bacterium 19S3-7]|nr:DUF4823 domain-containing protein [Thiotrichales bacterium 19S3-7]MCF6802995.1 DUF4823 domain-containing protein [Thiotrichales bacterium 19S3-11]
MKRKIKTIVTAVSSAILVSLVSACSGVHQVVRADGKPLGLQTSPEISQSTSQRVLILMANDGSDDAQIYKGSGKITTQLIQNVFRPYFKVVKLESLNGSLENQLEMAKSQGYQYIIIPEILQWSDHYTFWTGVPDEVSLNLKIYNTNTQQQIDSFTIKSESSLTPKPNQKPQDLLYQPLKQIAKVMFNHDVS